MERIRVASHVLRSQVMYWGYSTRVLRSRNKLRHVTIPALRKHALGSREMPKQPCERTSKLPSADMSDQAIERSDALSNVLANALPVVRPTDRRWAATAPYNP